MEIPPSLKALKPYLTHAKQTGKFDPLIAYYCMKLNFNRMSLISKIQITL